jgi:hypothetical protein
MGMFLSSVSATAASPRFRKVKGGHHRVTEEMEASEPVWFGIEFDGPEAICVHTVEDGPAARTASVGRNGVGGSGVSGAFTRWHRIRYEQRPAADPCH